MREWIVILKQENREALGALRAKPGLQCASHKNEIWLRAWEVDKKAPLELLGLPYQRLLQCDLEDRLFEPNGLTPVQRLPELPWERISQFLKVEIPTSLPPALLRPETAIRLVPSETERETDALLVDLKVLREYANHAPAIRLASLQFALNEHNKALLIGRPQLPLPGQSYYISDGMLLPAGLAFEYPLLSPYIAETLNPLRNSMILFDRTGAWKGIPWKNFVKGSRSAIRLSGKEANA